MLDKKKEKKEGQLRYKYVVLGRDTSYFVEEKKDTDSTTKFSEISISSQCMLNNDVLSLINSNCMSRYEADLNVSVVFFISSSMG